MIRASDFIEPCNCRSAGECHHNDLIEVEALGELLRVFGFEMHKKLMRKLMEGESGWDNPDVLPILKKALKTHVEKGDMVDVANLAAFIWNIESNAQTGSRPQD